MKKRDQEQILLLSQMEILAKITIQYSFLANLLFSLLNPINKNKIENKISTLPPLPL